MMTHTELKQVILDYIRELYKCEYTGSIKIEHLEPEGYKVSLYLNKSEYPVVIAAELPDDQFLVFLWEELRSRKLHRNTYYHITKL